MKKILLSLLVLLLFILGCAQKSTEQKSELAHTGTEGIVFNFLTNYPPNTIYTQGTGDTGNSIVLEVKNKGAYTTAVTFYLSGFDPSIINIGATTQTIGTIEGKTTTNKEGGYTQVQFPPYGTFSVNLPPGTDVYPATLQATACYDYQTKAVLPVCIDPDPYGIVKQKACTPKGAPTAGGQGAPVAITSVEQESLPGKVIFKIRVGNVGGGQVLEKGLSNICTSSLLRYNQIDKIQYNVKLGGAGGDCKPTTPLRLVNNQATITCSFNVGTSKLAYTTTLDVELNYGYLSSVQKSIQIKKI
ncbi:MAG: hypothetical protein QXG86_03370 [Candidatus Woesearchaeota archaeon]